MASPVTNHPRRSPHRSTEWSPRQTVDDNFRKNPDNIPAKLSLDCRCRADERSSRRYEAFKGSPYRHQSATQSDHELYKLPEERSSDEASATEVDVTDNAHEDVRPTYRNYESAGKKYENLRQEYPSHIYGKSSVSHHKPQYEKAVDAEDVSDTEDAESPAAVPTDQCQRNIRNYMNSVNLPQALIAMRKLERLKELQRRRDLSEKFYSHEIKRLIGRDFFNNNAIVADTTGKIREQQRTAESGNRAVIGDSSNHPVGEQRIRAGGFSKELAPCGTMTTITRFDCGCVRETTRPIFNSGIDHVEKCEDHRNLSYNISKLTPANAQELTYRPVGPLVAFSNPTTTAIKGKPRYSPDSIHPRSPQAPGSRDLESSWQDRRSYNQPQTRIKSSPGYISPTRKSSPRRNQNDTASDSQAE